MTWIVLGLLLSIGGTGALVVRHRAHVRKPPALATTMDWAMLEALREVDAIGYNAPPVLMVTEDLSNAAYEKLKMEAAEHEEKIRRDHHPYTLAMIDLGFSLEPRTMVWRHPEGREISHEEVMRDGVERIQNGEAWSDQARRDREDREYQARCANDRERYQRELAGVSR